MILADLRRELIMERIIWQSIPEATDNAFIKAFNGRRHQSSQSHLKDGSAYHARWWADVMKSLLPKTRA